jgi:hypothetical protein
MSTLAAGAEGAGARVRCRVERAPVPGPRGVACAELPSDGQVAS